MGKSSIQTGPSLLLKIKREGTQIFRTIGFLESIEITVTNGQKAIMAVDTPFPVEIAQSAGRSSVRGTMNVYFLKGTTLESIGLVPNRTGESGENVLDKTLSVAVGIYDKFTDQKLYEIEGMKVAQYSMSIKSRSVVRVSLSFEGLYFTPNPEV
jgi:hypothetical protein